MTDKIDLMMCRIDLIGMQTKVENIIKTSKSQIVLNHMSRIYKEINESLVAVSELVQRMDYTEKMAEE